MKNKHLKSTSRQRGRICYNQWLSNFNFPSYYPTAEHINHISYYRTPSSTKSAWASWMDNLPTPVKVLLIILLSNLIFLLPTTFYCLFKYGMYYSRIIFGFSFIILIIVCFALLLYFSVHFKSFLDCNIIDMEPHLKVPTLLFWVLSPFVPLLGQMHETVLLPLLSVSEMIYIWFVWFLIFPLWRIGAVSLFKLITQVFSLHKTKTKWRNLFIELFVIILCVIFLEFLFHYMVTTALAEPFEKK